MMRRNWRFLFFIPLIFILIGCEPIRITTKLDPFNIEPPKEPPLVKKLPNDAAIVFDDSQKFSATHHNFDAGVIHTVEFPVGDILRQVLPIYFDSMFSKVIYERNPPSSFSKDGLVIHVSIDNINFSEKCCAPAILEVNARTYLGIYDNELLPTALPVYVAGSGKTTKTGLFASINEKDYGNTAYQAIFNSVKAATDALYEAVKNPRAQISEAKQLINKDPSNASAYKVVANLSLRQNDIAEAIAASQMYVQLSPKDPDGYLLLYKCYLAQRKYKDALKQLEQATSLSPSNARFFMKLDEFYSERGRYDKAIEAIKKYLIQKPDDKYAALRLAILYSWLGRYDEAIKVSETAIQKLTFSGVGLSIIKNDNEYVKIKSVEPNSPAVRAGLQSNYEIVEIDGKSTLTMKLSDAIQALRGQEGTEVRLTIKKSDTDETFKKTLVRERFYKDPVVASYMSVIALCNIETENILKAKQYIAQAEKLSHDNKFLRLAKGALFLKEGQYEKTLSEIASLVDEDYAKILQVIALAKLGRYEDSLGVYRKIKRETIQLIMPKTKGEIFTSLLPYLEKIENKAIEYERERHYGQALKEYARLVEISEPDKAQRIRNRVARIISQNPSLIELKDEVRKYFLHAEILFNNNKFEEALLELDKARQLQPFNPQIYFNQAVIYEKISDYAKAVENMEIYLQLNPNIPNAQTIKDQIYKWRFIIEKES